MQRVDGKMWNPREQGGRIDYLRLSCPSPWRQMNAKCQQVSWKTIALVLLLRQEQPGRHHCSCLPSNSGRFAKAPISDGLHKYPTQLRVLYLYHKIDCSVCAGDYEGSSHDCGKSLGSSTYFKTAPLLNEMRMGYVQLFLASCPTLVKRHV